MKVSTEKSVKIAITKDVSLFNILAITNVKIENPYIEFVYKGRRLLQ